jgi:8-oxo-dGTP diphosphatase
MAVTSHDSETPANGQQVITACAFIHQRIDGTEKLFLARRAETKKFLPGNFELPGGHIEFKEDIIDGLKREVLEELNMHISVGDPFAAFTYANNIKGSHSIEVVYFSKFIDPIENIKINSEDHSEYKWISEKEIFDTPNISPEELKNIKRGFELLRGESQLFN